jgi:universal stress protein E
MQAFKKILVAVDLAGDGRFVSESLPTPTKEAIRQAEWVAMANGAKLEYFYALPQHAEQLSHDRQILMAQSDTYKSVFEHAGEVLSGMAEQSKRKGLSVSSNVTFGESWIELIREVIRSNIDLVVVGTRRRGQFRTMLFGSTGIKLLRKCPCPVWITKPQQQNDEWIDSILVAHDLTPVGERALQIGFEIAKRRNCQLHVFHAVNRGQFPTVNFSTADQAREEINHQLERLALNDAKVKISITDSAPCKAILDYIQSNSIELVVMGTIARTGVSGMLVGNTAEKVLPFLPCSILAIKPAGFKSPVSLDE